MWYIVKPITLDAASTLNLKWMLGVIHYVCVCVCVFQPSFSQYDMVTTCSIWRMLNDSDTRNKAYFISAVRLVAYNARMVSGGKRRRTPHTHTEKIKAVGGLREFRRIKSVCRSHWAHSLLILTTLGGRYSPLALIWMYVQHTVNSPIHHCVN